MVDRLEGKEMRWPHSTGKLRSEEWLDYWKSGNDFYLKTNKTNKPLRLSMFNYMSKNDVIKLQNFWQALLQRASIDSVNNLTESVYLDSTCKSNCSWKIILFAWTLQTNWFTKINLTSQHYNTLLYEIMLFWVSKCKTLGSGNTHTHTHML